MAGHDQDSWQDQDGQPLETEQLQLAPEEERLPWLESPDDEDWEENEGAGPGRLLGLMVAGLVSLGAIVGGIWWVTHRTGNPAQVADGSLIEAPATPYKEAPRNPGGKTFDGTGDSSFAVSEGQSRPPQLSGPVAPPPAPVAAPSAAPVAPATGAKPAAKPAAAPTATASGGVGVQVGAFSSQTAAEAGWNKLVAQANGALSGVSHRVIAGNADIGTVYRLQAVAGDAGAANALCGRLKAAGISCQVK